jgi:hypothetical protein
LRAGFKKRAAAILATKEDLTQDPQLFKKEIDKKLVAYLRVLRFNCNGTYRLTHSLNRAIRLKSPAAVMGLLCTTDLSTLLTPTQAEMLYEEVPLAIEDRMVRREMVMRLTWCLKEQGKLQALKLAAGKLNDPTLMLWVIKHFPKWDPIKLRDWGLVPAVRFGNMAAARLLLGRYVLAPCMNMM